ncbi:MAG: acylphosphatase, partial [Candidatus Altiarchaeota archaeon]|nr:acylphosphatase [Candidatus Altiarchaeota archaeon]
MMERAEIIVRGRVQRVGYRDYVAEVGNRLDLGGRVSNLPDKTVQIIAEGERRVLDEFISLLKPKDDPLIKVTGSDVKFEKATGEFEYFDLEYGDFTAEGFERIGVAASYLKSIDRKQDRMLDKQDSMLDKQDVMIGKQDETIEKIDSGNKLLAEKIDSGNEMLGGKIDSGNK